MILNIEDLRKANIDDLTNLEHNVLLQVFEVFELSHTERLEIEHLYKICDSMVEYIQTKPHNINFVSFINNDLENIICSLNKEDIELECGDHLYFIQQNDKGYTFEEMKEILNSRITQIYEDFFLV